MTRLIMMTLSNIHRDTKKHPAPISAQEIMHLSFDDHKTKEEHKDKPVDEDLMGRLKKKYGAKLNG
jgi:hypothetical protein